MMTTIEQICIYMQRGIFEKFLDQPKFLRVLPIPERGLNVMISIPTALEQGPIIFVNHGQ